MTSLAIYWETSDLDENGSPTTGWDGTSDGEVPQGTYVWRIEAAYIDGEPWKGMLIDGKRVQSGIITLVRYKKDIEKDCYCYIFN